MVASRVPGPQGTTGRPDFIDEGTLARMANPVPTSLGIAANAFAGSTMPMLAPIEMPALPTVSAKPAAQETASADPVPLTAIDNDTRMLAATAYGEGSLKNVFEEMAAIANVLVRQQKARGYASAAAFIKADKSFAFAAHDGNERYARLMAATLDEINLDAGMRAAVRGASNALANDPHDYSNGAYFWDGADIKTNYPNHAKVLGGIHISKPEHNIYSIKDKEVPDEAFWIDAKGNKGKSRGKWRYKYDSTAAWGGTIFWKYNADFLKASGNKVYK